MFNETWFRSSVSSDHLIHPPLGSSPKIPEGTAWKRPIVPIRDETRLTLWPIDPYRIFAAVSIASQDPRIDRSALSSLTIRVLDITGSNGGSTWEDLAQNACYTFDISLGQARSWYIPLWDSERTLTAFLGTFEPNGTFHPVFRANIIKTPSGKVHRKQGTLHHHEGGIRKESLLIDPEKRLLQEMMSLEKTRTHPGSSEHGLSSLFLHNLSSSSEYRSPA